MVEECTACGGGVEACPTCGGGPLMYRAPEPESGGEPQQGDGLALRGKLRSVVLHVFPLAVDVGREPAVDRAVELIEALVREQVEAAIAPLVEYREEFDDYIWPFPGPNSLLPPRLDAHVRQRLGR